MALWGGSHARYFRELPRKSLHNFLSTVCPGTGRPRAWATLGSPLLYTLYVRSCEVDLQRMRVMYDSIICVIR